MGKYMKKSKLTAGDIAVMEVSPQSSPRLRTRAAKTLALQRLNKPSSQSPASSTPKSPSSSSYLQLRSRRLEKPPISRQQHSGQCCQDSASEKRIPGVETEKKLLEFGVQNERTAEKIPSSLVRELSSVEKSLSTRKEMDSCTTDSRVEMELLRSIPTSKDIEEFFAHEELWHQRTFIQKYNFDFANDSPLQGRYEWLQVVP